MSLTKKLAQLQTDADIALRIAAFWQKQIAEHGEAKATSFYQHLGLNHLDDNHGAGVINEDSKRTIEVNIHPDPSSAFKTAALFGEKAASVFIPAHRQKKGVEWEGMTLSREPKEHEKIAVKGVFDAQESGKASVTVILLKLRTTLIDDALKAIKKLTPVTYHELILKTPKESKVELREQLTKIFNKGRRLVAQELSKTKEAILDDDDDEFLDELADLTGSRTANEIQARITAAAARYRLLGLEGAALNEAIAKEMADGSVSYIDRAAHGVANRVLNIGRSREADDRKDEWENVEYSALLDQNVCDPCAADDGETSTSEVDLTDTPNPDCAGGDWCRCFHVFIAPGG